MGGRERARLRLADGRGSRPYINLAGLRPFGKGFII